jgi:hypothetical protein
MKLCSGFLTISFILLLNGETSLALPRFALMQGTKCQSCHLNPTGGGMRNDYGVTYSIDKVPLESTKDSDFTFSGKLSDHISIGGDTRGQFIYDKGSASTGFQAMTTSIYGSVHINKKYYFYFKQDLVNPGYGYLTGPELFGLAKVLPGGWYVKGGVFMPNFGWRLDDHTAYTRGGDLGYANAGFYQSGLIFVPNYKDVGIEVGGYLGDLFVTGGVFNGDGNQAGKQISMKKSKAFAVKAEYSGALSGVNYTLGVSGYNYDTLSIGGVNLGFGAGDVTVLGEFDVTKKYATGNPAVDAFNPGGNTMAAHGEIDYRIMQGLWAMGMFDIFDPIQGIASTDLKRITVGMEFFPFPFVEFRPQYRHTTDDLGTSNDQALVQMHLWF